MNSLTTGLTIALYGMGIVFGLLALFWGLVAALVRTDTPPALPETPTGTKKTGVTGATASQRQTVAPELATALTIAVISYRTHQRRQAAPIMRSHLPGAHLHASRWVAAGRTRQNRTWSAQRG